MDSKVYPCGTGNIPQPASQEVPYPEDLDCKEFKLMIKEKKVISADHAPWDSYLLTFRISKL
jgi:hypothetical protein